MGINAYYDDYSDELMIRPLLTDEQVISINDKLTRDNPFQVANDMVTTPDDGFKTCYPMNHDDADELVRVIDLIIKENPDCKVNGEVFVTWDCDDECDRIQVVDNRVYISHREHTFSEPKQVNDWI